MTPLRARLDARKSALLMGILNRTPDSFSDGGRFLDDDAALAQVDAMIAEGAEVIDLGAESTRPGAEPVAASEQIARLGDLVRVVAQRGTLVSIDTTSPEVAAWALADGATIVNSIALEPAAALGALAAKHGAALVLMHSRGPMSAMKGFSVYADEAYGDVVADVAREWLAAADRALAAGLPRESLLLDPGLGFAKNARQSLELCARLDELCALGFPVLVGPSRKSFVARAAMEGREGPLPPPEARLGGTIAATIACVERGARVVRAHDIAPVKQALAVAAALRGAGGAKARATPSFSEGARHA